MAHFGWTYDYLLNGIGWATVQKMMLDAPSYDTEGDGEPNITLTEDNGEQIMNYINAMM